VNAEWSAIAAQLAAITAEVAENKALCGYVGTAARLLVAAAVFGATDREWGFGAGQVARSDNRCGASVLTV
jgi:hypothetical protein